MIDSLVIDRAKWNGSSSLGTGSSALLLHGGKMCCLGFLGRACGVPNEAMLNQGFPCSHYTLPHANLFPDAFVEVRDESAGHVKFHNTQLTYDAAQINDSELPVADKEARLIALFKEAGITLTFTGEAEAIA